MRRSLAVVVAAVLLAGCGGDEQPDAPASVAATIAGFEFDPDPIRVKAGGTVRWTNSDRAPHTAQTAGQGFDTGRLDLGEAKTVTIDAPGTYRYFCVFHRFMTGTVEVVE